MNAHTPTESLLLPEEPGSDDRTFLNASLWYVDKDGYRVVFHRHEPIYRIALNDEVHLRLVAVMLRQSRVATQEEICRAFGHSLAETETAEIIRRRLFEWDGMTKDAEKNVAAFADWSLEHRTQVPGWFPVDNAREAFRATYPFHPVVLSMFERKWQQLPRFQQTRGILRLLALWVSKAYHDGFKGAHRDPLIGLGIAPLDDAFFRTAVSEKPGNPAMRKHGYGAALAVATAGASLPRSRRMLLDGRVSFQVICMAPGSPPAHSDLVWHIMPTTAPRSSSTGPPLEPCA